MSSNFATSNRVSLGVVRETSWGQCPPTPVFQKLRYASESLKYTSNFTASTEIRADRMLSDTIKTEGSAAGDITCEFSYKTYDEILEGLMFSFWKYSPIQTAKIHEIDLYTTSLITTASTSITASDIPLINALTIVDDGTTPGTYSLQGVVTVANYPKLFLKGASYVGVETKDGKIRRGKMTAAVDGATSSSVIATIVNVDTTTIGYTTSGNDATIVTRLWLDPVLTPSELVVNVSAQTNTHIHLIAASDYNSLTLLARNIADANATCDLSLKTPYALSSYNTTAADITLLGNTIGSYIFDPGNVVQVTVGTTAADKYTFYAEVTANNFVTASANKDYTVTLVPYDKKVNMQTYLGTTISDTKNIVRSIRVLPKIRNDIFDSQFTFVKTFEDLNPNVFWFFTGTKVSKFVLTFGTGAVLKNTISLMSRTADMFKQTELSATTDLSGNPTDLSNILANGVSSSTFKDPNTNTIMNSVDNVASIIFDDKEADSEVLFFNSLTLTIDNTLRGQKAVGNLPFIGIVPGKFNTTGSIELYFKDKSIYDKFKNTTTFSLSLQVKDVDGNCYFIRLPKCKYTNIDIVAGGLDQDVFAKTDFTCLAYTGTTGDDGLTVPDVYQMQICKSGN